MAVTLPADERRELEEQGADDAAREIEARERAAILRKYPKPTAAGILDWKQQLDETFRPFWMGDSADQSGAGRGKDDGGDSLASIRDMRYGRDTTPEKLQKRMEHTYRVRSMFTHNEIDRVVALLGRNPIKVQVPNSGTTAETAKRSEKQSQFCNALPLVIDTQSGFPLTQRTDDALTEAGLVAMEFYLTGEYDDIDWEYQELDAGENESRRETDNERDARLRESRRQRRLPFGYRYVDPSSLRFEMSGEKPDEPCVALICERKRWRTVRDKVTGRRRPVGVDDKETIPHPGDLGQHGDSASTYETHSDAQLVDTIRYYDEYWYAYVVAGELVECEPHGLPGVPVMIGTGRVTSSSNYGEMFQGVTWGRTRLEQSFNDLASIIQDTKATYSRPKPIAIAKNANPAAEGLNQSTAFTLDLSGDDLIGLPPGYEIDDAFKHFRSTENDGFLQLLMSLYQMGGMSPIAQGESPGSDVSGYLVNTLQGAANAKYEGLLDNKTRMWRRAIDYTRRVIRDVIGEEVELLDVVGGDDGESRWLSLGPDDIDDTPCLVTIDPLSEQDRMALAAFYMQGLEAGLVPPDEVMRRVYNASNIEQWVGDIARGRARSMLMNRAVQDAMERVDEDAADRAAKNNPAPTILGADGRPLPPTPQGRGQMPSPAEMPAGPPATPAPSVGAPAMEAMRSANPQNAGFPPGQRPVGNGMTAREALGG